VLRHQRDRILSSVADVVADVGYGAMSVEDIIVAAGVSRRTFYDHYRSKEEAFLASYDAVVSTLTQAVEDAHDGATGFEGRVRASLRAFVDTLCESPRSAYMCIVEVLAAGPAAIERRNRAMADFAALIVRSVEEELPKRGRPPELTAQTVVGGLYEVIYTRVIEERMDELPELVPDLLFSMLLPYVGHDAAIAELRRERRRVRRVTAA
jgi:AcrR family transcriptional regulator